MEYSGQRLKTFYTMGIFALFLAGFLVLVVYGANIYRSSVSGQNENNLERALESYVYAAVRNSDAEGCVKISDGPEGDALILSDHENSEYESRIYLYSGRLLQEYTAADSDCNPDNAIEIGETQIFAVKIVSDSLLLVTTDSGDVYLHIRSDGGICQ